MIQTTEKKKKKKFGTFSGLQPNIEKQVNLQKKIIIFQKKKKRFP